MDRPYGGVKVNESKPWMPNDKIRVALVVLFDDDENVWMIDCFGGSGGSERELF